MMPETGVGRWDPPASMGSHMAYIAAVRTALSEDGMTADPSPALKLGREAMQAMVTLRCSSSGRWAAHRTCDPVNRGPFGYGATLERSARRHFGTRVPVFDSSEASELAVY